MEIVSRGSSGEKRTAPIAALSRHLVRTHCTKHPKPSHDKQASYPAVLSAPIRQHFNFCVPRGFIQTHLWVFGILGNPLTSGRKHLTWKENGPALATRGRKPVTMSIRWDKVNISTKSHGHTAYQSITVETHSLFPNTKRTHQLTRSQWQLVQQRTWHKLNHPATNQKSCTPVLGLAFVGPVKLDATWTTPTTINFQRQQ